MNAIAFESGRFYVMDRFATTMQGAYVSGPFEAEAEAEADRRERNIGDDCEIFQMPVN
jgi:hypothetical protein